MFYHVNLIPKTYLDKLHFFFKMKLLYSDGFDFKSLLIIDWQTEMQNKTKYFTQQLYTKYFHYLFILEYQSDQSYTCHGSDNIACITWQLVWSNCLFLFLFFFLGANRCLNRNENLTLFFFYFFEVCFLYSFKWYTTPKKVLI